MSYIHGRNVILYNDGTAFAGAKSCDLEVDCEEIETSSSVNGAWKTFLAGRKEWSVTTSFLVTAVNDIKKCLNVGTSYTLNFCENTTNYPVKLTGTAILKTCRITATKGNLCTGSFQFVGNGELAEPTQ